MDFSLAAVSGGLLLVGTGVPLWRLRLLLSTCSGPKVFSRTGAQRLEHVGSRRQGLQELSTESVIVEQELSCPFA